jgi:hypothetical protein
VGARMQKSWFFCAWIAGIALGCAPITTLQRGWLDDRPITSTRPQTQTPFQSQWLETSDATPQAGATQGLTTTTESPELVTSGLVVPAASPAIYPEQLPPVVTPTPANAQASNPLPSLPMPQAPGNPVGVPAQPAGQVGSQIQLLPSDPHVRTTPTVTGERLNLGPSEIPADRVLGLTTQLELLLSQNRDLSARIKELEAQGKTREQALTEALREVDAASDAVQRAQLQIQSLQAQIVALQKKLQQMEEEDIRMLKAVIAALERFLNAPPDRRLP